jgi:tetratricopeptide (TPR) repeat protein
LTASRSPSRGRGRRGAARGRFFLPRAAAGAAEKGAAQEAALAAILGKLAFALVGQGKFADAEPVLRRRLELQSKVLAADHPDIADSLNLVSLVTRAQRLGADDPDLAMSLNNLAALYVNQGKYAEAEPLYRRALAIREKALGLDHPDVAGTLEGYAALLRKTQRDAEAAQLEERARAIRASNPGSKAKR